MRNRLLLLFLFFISCIITEAQTVYKTKTGAKYHTSSCRYLKSSYEINLQDAIQEGLTACSVCNPARAVQSQSNNYQSSNLVEGSGPNSTYSTSGSQQCTGTTKAGSRCKRMTKASNGRCYQH